MKVSVLIGSYGQQSWRDLAWSRAFPSATAAQPYEVVIDHFPEGDINSTRNALAARARGDWLCFLDADDELAVDYLAQMEQAFEGKDTLYTPAVVKVFSRGRPRPPVFYDEVDLRGGNWLVIGTLIERRLFRRIGGFRDWPHGLEDWDLWARAHYAGAQVVRVPQAHYVQHREGPSSHAVAARDRERYRRSYEAVLASHEDLR